MKRMACIVFGCLTLVMCYSAVAGDDLGAIVDSRILEAGDDFIHGFAYFDGYLWASTRTNPCRILRIHPETLGYDRIILEAGLNDGEDLIAVEGYIWVILHMSPAIIVRVDPKTMKYEIAISFRPEEMFDGGSLEYAYGYLWAGGRNGKIARIDLKTLSYDVYDYSEATGNFQIHALASGGGYIWGSSYSYQSSWLWGTTFLDSVIVRINPDNPTEYSSLFMSSTTISDDIAYVNGFLYAGSERTPSYIYKIKDDLSYVKVRASDSKCYGVFSWDNEIWGTFVSSPGTVIRFDLDLTPLAVYQFPQGFNMANEMAFDLSGNLYYITCWENPAKIVKLEKHDLNYLISSMPDKDRGGVIIPADIFPEGKGEIILIHVPTVINGSNGIRDDGGWITVKEIEQSKLNFQWEKLAAGINLQGADTSAGAALSATAGLIEAFYDALSVSQCKVAVQRNAKGELRAILSVGDPDRRSFFRMHAGQTWDPISGCFWLVRAVFSEEIANTFNLEPDSFPQVFYTITMNIDQLHRDDRYVGYLSLSQGNITITPRVYPDDKLRVLRIHQLLIPYKSEVIFDFAGDALARFLEGPVDPGFVEAFSLLPSDSAIVVQGHSPIELRAYDSQMRASGVVNGQIKGDIPGSIYDQQHNILLIQHPADAYLYEVKGMGNGGYSLDIDFVQNGEPITFTASSIPISPTATHQYAVDWDVLSRGEAGAMIQVDNDGDGAFEYSMASDMELTRHEYLIATGVTPGGKESTTWAYVKQTTLFQNYPNPFNPETWIPYQLEEESDVSIIIYDVAGRLVKCLDLGHKPVGIYVTKDRSAHWDGRNDAGEIVSSGVYIVVFKAGDYENSQRIVLIR